MIAVVILLEAERELIKMNKLINVVAVETSYQMLEVLLLYDRERA